MTHTHIHTYIHTHIHTYVHTHMCIYIYIYVNIQQPGSRKPASPLVGVPRCFLNCIYPQADGIWLGFRQCALIKQKCSDTKAHADKKGHDFIEVAR